jgi:hypothetical protein
MKIINTVKETTSDTFRELSRRIQATTNGMSLDILETRCTRHYNNGTITAAQLAKLDGMIQLRLARL